MDSQKINKLIDKLNDSKSLIDVLIQMEDYLDSLDLYVYKNWFDGEIVDGPNITRYWVSMILKYPHKKMPDPQGALRLIKHGAKVSFNKSFDEVPVTITQPSDYRPGSKKPKMDKEPIWLVTVQIPRRFIEELDDSDLELYADEIDVDDVSDARDDNIDSGSDIVDGDNKSNESEEDDLGLDDLDLGDEDE